MSSSQVVARTVESTKVGVSLDLINSSQELLDAIKALCLALPINVDYLFSFSFRYEYLCFLWHYTTRYYCV